MMKGADVLVGVTIWMALGVGACATSGEAAKPEARPAAAPGGTAGQAMAYGGGDGTSCAQAVVVHAANEMAGVRAEYAWIAAKYPGYTRGAQALLQCNDRPADKIHVRTADGRELELFFDISEYFGNL
jgi:hypothetical protein